MELCKGQRYRSFDGFGNHWDIDIQYTAINAAGKPAVYYLSMKNDSGEWLDDMSPIDGFLYGIETGRIINIPIKD